LRKQHKNAVTVMDQLRCGFCMVPDAANCPPSPAGHLGPAKTTGIGLRPTLPGGSGPRMTKALKRGIK